MTTEQKYTNLKDILLSYPSVAVAYSAGVDSTFLLKTAHDLLGDRAFAITARIASMPARELAEAEAFCKQEGIRHIILDFDVFSVKAFAQNDKLRCYHCKKALFTEMLAAANARGVSHLIEGTNADDQCDDRPGMRAIAELGIQSPLQASGLTKSEIRTLSEKIGLSTWNKPSFACLASRFPYGDPITEERLRLAESAEQLLWELGISQARVRIHGTLARIEVLPQDFPIVLQNADMLNKSLKKLGFSYVSLDLGGYQTGNMNQ